MIHTHFEISSDVTTYHIRVSKDGTIETEDRSPQKTVLALFSCAILKGVAQGDNLRLIAQLRRLPGIVRVRAMQNCKSAACFARATQIYSS
ncbi:MAG: hypothetical protein H7A36_06410 [Chlamydiales bacterium]|nr:hypothetical protein [Chlamydiales bacterium]